MMVRCGASCACLSHCLVWLSISPHLIIKALSFLHTGPSEVANCVFFSRNDTKRGLKWVKDNGARTTLYQFTVNQKPALIDKHGTWMSEEDGVRIVE